MGFKKNNNKFISYLIILISLFVLFLVTYKQYETLQINLDINSSLQIEKQDKLDLIESNKKIESDLEKSGNLTQKYLREVNENNIIEYIFDYVEGYNTDESKIQVLDISITKGIKNDLGFTESDINISATVLNYETMKRFLDFFVSSNSKYNFVIKDFNFPNDGKEGSFNIKIPLKIYYN